MAAILLAAACGPQPADDGPAEIPGTSPMTSGTQTTPPAGTPPTGASSEASPAADLIPIPVSVSPTPGAFTLTDETEIHVWPNRPELVAIGEFLGERLRPATGFDLPVRVAGGPPESGSIRLTTESADPELGAEGYGLKITGDFVLAVAPQPAGLFWAVQTIRQLLPPSIEAAAARPGPWRIPAATIRDFPRFEWRGAMLDVARHFFGVEDVQRFIDLMAYHKLNRLHLHLSDDQGWRIMIESWPNLAIVGGSTAVGGDPGGYFTQEEYAAIVAYAQARYVVIVPEIDMPGHTRAAQASYPELNCDGMAPPLYTGIEVGFSSLCLDREVTFRFIDDVVRELAALTPGEFLHLGGDEATATTPADYRRFVERVQAIVRAHGKRMIGWEEIAQADLEAGTVAQHWSTDLAARAVSQGARVILSPAARAYLDMQYDPGSPLGLHWAGYVDVQAAYDWDPASQVAGVGESDILGVEAPLWSETLRTIGDIEFMAFPRLVGIAEIAWSPAAGRAWDEYRQRLAAHGGRLQALGVNFYRAPQIDWR